MAVLRKTKPTAKPAAKTKVAAKKPVAKTAAKPATAKQPVAAKPTAAPRAAMTSFRPALSVGGFSAHADSRVPPQLQSLIEKSDIADRIYAYCRAVDRIDETLLRTVFHPDATLDLGPGVFQGTASDYIPWLLGVLQQMRASHHMVANIRSDVEGDAALVESYFTAHHRLDKSTGREDVFLGGRYLDRFERRPGGPSGIWKIMHRKQILDYVRTEAVSDIFYHQNPDALWSYRTKTDPSYQMAQFPGSQSGNKLPSFVGRKYEVKSVRF
jgi:hypothetical protein